MRAIRKERIKSIIIILLALLLILMMGMEGYILFSHNWKVKEYTRVDLQVPTMEYNLTKAQAKELVKDLYDTPHFFTEKELQGATLGQSYILWRVAEINFGLDVEDFTITYAHELTHIKYQVQNETYITFMTFKVLYESGNAVLQNMALRHARVILGGGYNGTAYDCGYYILDYLRDIQYEGII